MHCVCGGVTLFHCGNHGEHGEEKASPIPGAPPKPPGKGLHPQVLSPQHQKEACVAVYGVAGVRGGEILRLFLYTYCVFHLTEGNSRKN